VPAPNLKRADEAKREILKYSNFRALSDLGMIFKHARANHCPLPGY